ncbi:MAG: Xaa-Pro peptidase family protein [bacterium]|jgi:Xaa-Pro dipeptidase|nr:Xaa-Pro peptidase family protein [bacterium]
MNEPLMLLPREEASLRIDRLHKAMAGAGIDGLLVADNADIFYLTGRVYAGFAYIPAGMAPLWFVRRPVELEGDGVVYIRKPEDMASHIVAAGLAMPRRLGLELDILSFNQAERLRSVFPGAECVDTTPMMRAMRAVKTDFEVEQMRLSGLKHEQVYRKIPKLYRVGMTDVELQVEIERISRLEGCLGVFRISGQSMEIYMGNVLAGRNADVPAPYDFAMGGRGLDPSIPGGAAGEEIKEHNAVMVDLNGNFTGYMTDMTRVFAVGSLPQEAVDAHQCSIDICRAFEREARPGVEARTLYEMCADMARERGLERYFMGHRQHAGFVGHGVGIEVNEWPVIAPRSRQILERNNTIALEPKFVIPEVGAVGIENTYVIEDTGARSLTNAPEEIVQLI